jgi:hypothetical protein
VKETWEQIRRALRENIFDQLDTRSNELVMIFFAKVGSENHHIPIFILMG